MLADQGKGENGHGWTRKPKDGGGAGEAGACLVGGVPGRGSRLWVRGTWREGVGGDERNLQVEREDLSSPAMTASSQGGGCGSSSSRRLMWDLG